ncbi:ABC transporter permease [Flammeovirga sp. SubArs3]|uniref:ABC transporter permease n=1 Tax=Flammeovirga sp. SubArs3 TaxID=2995316 RepID=UPI00248B3B5D|nr:ABC transporter permease [Flammeovirga sp. SubArs3]
MKTYIKLAWYSLKKNPFFSFIILFGISITIMIVMFVGSILETGYGSNGIYKDIDQVLIAPQLKVKRTEGNGWSNSGFSYSAFKDYFSKMKTPEVMSVTMNHWYTNLYYKDLGLDVQRMSIDNNFTKIFPLQFIIGRPFSFEDLEQRKKLVIISKYVADNIFGTEDPLNKKIKIQSEYYEVIGVIEDVNKMRRQATADVYTPLDIYQKENTDWHRFLGNNTMLMKFKDKDSMEAGQDEFQHIISLLPINKEHNEESMSAKFLTEKAWLFYHMLEIEDEKLFGVYLSLIAFFVMLIPALSLINLNITRTSERTAEMGIRKSFGASSLDLLYQLLMENIFTTLIGGFIGVLLTFVVIYLFNTYGWIGNNFNLEINFQLLIYGLGCTLFFSLMSGFYPALKISNFGIISSLKNDKQ